MTNYYIPSTKKSLVEWLAVFYPITDLKKRPKNQLYAIYHKIRKGLQ